MRLFSVNKQIKSLTITHLPLAYFPYKVTILMIRIVATLWYLRVDMASANLKAYVLFESMSRSLVFFGVILVANK